MPGRWIEIDANLGKCRKITMILKQKNPKLVMDLNSNTIVVYRKDSKLCCPYHRLSKDSIAHQHWDFCPSNPSGICIRQEFLFFPFVSSTYNDYVDKKPHSVWLEGTWAIIDLICHEIAHFAGSSAHSIHGKKWLDIYQKFLRQMVLEVISGNYYTWYTNHYKVIN
ncbi:hypothetical protein AAA799O18_00069 [Marine Group I thaumarchaeote SCGC AAA799-O18]|jgi:hypothetical protein|nr:hypothetical protein AAA799O18_00069 [Marine Group I thaumarchaeote SCGC AAA799-O18]